MKTSSYVINVLGISGSPRDGNSRYLLKEALKAAQDVDAKTVMIDEYSFRGKKFSPCIACFRCDGDEKRRKGECVIKDDFQALRDKWVGADVVIYSVPVYHVGIPGQLKCFMDRLGNTVGKYYNVSSPRHLKVIGAIARDNVLEPGKN